MTCSQQIIVELHPDKVPKTAHNFLSLCQGVKEGGGGRRADGVELSYKVPMLLLRWYQCWY